jgi:hypothetical protein
MTNYVYHSGDLYVEYDSIWNKSERMLVKQLER